MALFNCAIFLDRDGTIIKDKEYLSDSAGVELLSNAREAIEIFLKNKCALFLFSNQSGVGRGLFTLNDVHKCNARMIELINLGDEIFLDKCIAVEGPDDKIEYRKPSPKFIFEMLAKYNFAKNDCFMVGDKLSDVQAGYNAGINTVLISSATKIIKNASEPHYGAKIFKSLFDFACYFDEVKNN